MRLRNYDGLHSNTDFRETPNHSYWIEEKGLNNIYKFICAHCGNRERHKANYCSYCGYIMDADKGSETQEVKDGVIISINRED